MRRAPEVSLELTKTHLVIRIPIEAKLVPIAKKAGVEAANPPYLPPQVLKVFEGVRQGLSNKEIGNKLGIAERTVKYNMSEIFKRTGISDRVQLLKRFGYALIMFLVLAVASPAQTKTSKPFQIQVGHVVTLSWAASTSTVASYSIYSSNTSGGPYFKIGSINSGVCCTYIDLNTIAGNTYYFVVTAVDSAGNESAYSNETSAVIPTP
jgi:hypothetical protein